MRERTLKLAVVASLLVNLFALGIIVGGAVTWLSAANRPAAGRSVRLIANLPAAEQARFHATLREVRRVGHPLQQTAFDNRQAAAALFVQPQFDAAAVNAALARARDADFALRVRLETAVVDFARTLPPPDRATLAKALAQTGPLRRAPMRNRP